MVEIRRHGGADPVLFNDENSPPLLGALAFEDAYLGVNPVEQILVPVDGLMMAGEIAAQGNR